MQTTLFIILVLLVPVLTMVILSAFRKHNSVLSADVKRLRVENEALRKEMLKRGIIEKVSMLFFLDFYLFIKAFAQ